MNEPIISPWLIYWAGRIEFIQIICCVVGLVVTAFAVTAAMAVLTDDYELAKINVIPFEKRMKMSSVLNIPVSELLYDNEKMACISTNEAVDELREDRLIKAVNAELEEWLCSGDTDYLHKAMAVIRAEIDNEE